MIPILEKLSTYPDVRTIIPEIKDIEGEHLLFVKARSLFGIPEPSTTQLRRSQSSSLATIRNSQSSI